ncbi:Nn.00g015340.m01.CDS01 [Neocucurbitaria sp. VM-36]
MASKSNFLSQTLQSITTTKMREQDKRRKTFEASKTTVLKSATTTSDDRARLEVLLSGFKDLSSSNKGVFYVDDDRTKYTRNVARYLEQSYRDPSVSSSVIQAFDRKFRQKLDQESQRFEFADLYYRLLGEWTNASSKPLAQSERKEEELDGSFEHVQKYDLDKLRDKFAGVVFTPLETDEVEIDNYLSSLFQDDHASNLLEKIRKANNAFAKELKERATPFNSKILKQCMQALLRNNLLNDDAKNTLSDFTTNDVVLDEIADVLNLRFADLDNWSWQADEGMYYEPRRQLNGKYRIMMDMDILQAIFLHYIAVNWCSHLKVIFKCLPNDNKFWRGPKKMTEEEKGRYYYFTGSHPTSGVTTKEMKTFCETFFLSAMPSSLVDSGDPYGEDKDAEAAADETKTGLGMRQMFLRQLATGAIIRRSLHGEVAVIQSDLQWYATGLPHSTLFAVLRFWGVPEDWIALFKKYAEAPLRMTATPGENVRTRKRGIPITDAFETLFGECILFCMDVAVNRLSDMTLIRFHDDLFLSGEPSQCANAWETIGGFVKVLGLDINTSKTGSIYLSEIDKDDVLLTKFPKGPVCMGMLQLNEEGDWAINQKQVAAHVKQLQTQLGQCNSIIAWIQTWNACMGRFFQDTFGKPANCFGQAHVDAILETHANMQRQLFKIHGGSVTNYLREQILERFSVDNVPDSFFFLPEDFGGLGVKNPFIPFFVLKDQVLKDPLNRIAEFRKDEKRAYKEASEVFAALSDADKHRRLRKALGESSKHVSVLSEPFFSFEEYTAHRETYSYELLCAFDELMLKPSVRDVHLAKEVGPWFEELSHSHGTGWYDLSSENKWIMHLYAEELKQRFGALSIVDKNLLPSGVMKMLKTKKITWQLIIWE